MYLGSLGSTQKLELLEACSQNFFHASVTRYTDVMHEPILYNFDKE